MHRDILGACRHPYYDENYLFRSHRIYFLMDGTVRCYGVDGFELCFRLPQPPEPPHKVVIDEPPPFLGTWRRVYLFVLAYLAFVIAAFYVFSRAYAP